MNSSHIDLISVTSFKIKSITIVHCDEVHDVPGKGVVVDPLQYKKWDFTVCLLPYLINVKNNKVLYRTFPFLMVLINICSNLFIFNE